MHLLVSLLAASAAPQRPLERPADYALAWSDEFERPGLPDPNRWRFDTEFNSRGWHNDEAQYYAERRLRNARVEGGRLIIQAHRERLDDREDWGGQDYSSARLTTKGRADWRYGFIEIRAKLPCTRGTWPAIWMLPANKSPDFIHGEIDIMEHVGHRPSEILHSLQTARQNHRRGNPIASTTRLSDSCEAFHTYQLHWTRSFVAFGIDGAETFRNARLPNRDWPFDHSFYLILNVAVGGTMGGEQGIDVDALPAAMEIDWVRVFQRR